jgi:hypothetical protein
MKESGEQNSRLITRRNIRDMVKVWLLGVWWLCCFCQVLNREMGSTALLIPHGVLLEKDAAIASVAICCAVELTSCHMAIYMATHANSTWK